MAWRYLLNFFSWSYVKFVCIASIPLNFCVSSRWTLIFWNTAAGYVWKFLGLGSTQSPHDERRAEDRCKFSVAGWNIEPCTASRSGGKLRGRVQFSHTISLLSFEWPAGHALTRFSSPHTHPLLSSSAGFRWSPPRPLLLSTCGAKRSPDAFCSLDLFSANRPLLKDWLSGNRPLLPYWLLAFCQLLPLVSF